MKKSIEKYIDNMNVEDSPILVYDLYQLENNIKENLYLKKKYNVDFIFPVKSFPSEKIISIFAKNEFGFDVANVEEYNMIKKYLNSESIVSCSGPYQYSIGKTSNNGQFLFNVNSLSQINDFTNGIRININNKKLNFSHFGVQDYLNSKIKKDKIECIHLHISDDNKLSKMKIINKHIKSIVENYRNLKFISIGGTWDINNYKELDLLISKFRETIPSDIKILVELGKYWCSNNVGYLVTKIVDINYINDKTVISVNAIKECAAKWSIPKLYSKTNCKPSNNTLLIFGYSCYEDDIFTLEKISGDFKINQKLVFNNINGYSYAWLSKFNGSTDVGVIFYE